MIISNVSVDDAGSYCRDPKGTEGQPWCFINETVIEFCGISECSSN